MPRRSLQEGKNIVYITLDGRIPSTSADSVCVTSMCGQFAAQGLDTMLLVPDRKGRPLHQLSRTAQDIFDFYSVTSPFEFRLFPNPLRGWTSRLASAYCLALVLYARARGFSLITARTIEAAVWAARLRIPVILESHNFSKLEHHRLIGRWISMARDMTRPISMVVTTQAGKTSYARIGVPPERIRVFPNGVNIERFSLLISKRELRSQLRLPVEGPLLAFSGSLHEGRGGEEMLDCAARLPEAQIVIVGGTPADVERYMRQAQRRQLGNVHLVGHVDQATLPKYLLAADILLMPYTTRFSAHSFEYTSPMKMFEYLATGNPMVATDFPVLHEVLEHGRNAIFVPPDSGEALADGARYLLQNPEIARQIGENAKADSRRYSWERRAREIIEWQRELGYLK